MFYRRAHRISYKETLPVSISSFEGGILTQIKTILFLCTHNAARSQIAEGLINTRHSDRYRAYSAGNEPTDVHRCAVEVMAEVGIDISAQRAKSLDEFSTVSFDYVVAMCADAAENCPSSPVAPSIVTTLFLTQCLLRLMDAIDANHSETCVTR